MISVVETPVVAVPLH